MPITVTMLQTRRGEGGVTWNAGSSYSASDAFGAYLITSNLATGVIPLPAQTGLSPDDGTAIKALVSGAGVANGTLLAEQTPNTLLTDTDTLVRQLGFITIPGGKMTARTRLEIGLVADLTGNDSKNLQMRVGAASGNFATATIFGGLSGLTTQRYTPLLSLIWADNALTALRTNPVGQGDWPRANTANPSLSIAVDTNLDWNIYVGFQSAVAGGAPTNGATLRTIWARVIG